jgi:PAS domain S-box-containing protein
MKSLQEEYNILKQRLERAESVIKAIQSGEIDAVVLNEQVSLIRPEAELRKTQADLEANRLNFKTLFDSIEDFLFIITTDGIIRHFNPIVENILGYDHSDLLGAHVSQLNDGTLQTIHSTHTNNDPIRFPECFFTSEGNVIHVETRISRGKWSGEDVYFCLSRDVTERKKYESELNRLNQKLTTLNHDLEHRVSERTKELNEARKLAEAANHAKSQFLANMSHELRTPLNGILGYTQILVRDATLTEKQKNALSVMHKSGEHLLMLINDILDLSKIESGKMELFPEIVFFEDFLNNIVEIIRIRAIQKNIQMVYKKSPDVPLNVSADAKCLRQILLNLLGNAVKFTPKGQVTFDVSMNQQAIRFKVIDTGIGISPEHQKDIFQSFHQVNMSKTSAGGTGLGLAISKRLIHMMKSKLYLESAPGKGSTFWFEVQFPEAHPQKKLSIKTNIELLSNAGKDYKILIVDDQTENRKMLKEMLYPYGFQLFEAVDGVDALEKALECIPDVILMDITMPKMNGMEATSRVKSMPLLKNTTVIVVTAGVMVNAKKECFDAGCDDFIPKPVQMDDLLSKLAHYLNLKTSQNQKCDRNDENLDTTMTLPQTDILEHLKQLAIKGDILKIKKEAKKFFDTPYNLFGQKLFKLAQAFNINEIKQLIGGMIDE